MFQSDEENDDDENITLPKLTEATDWVAFRDTFISKLASVKGSRGFPVNYIIDPIECDVTHVDSNLIEFNTMTCSSLKLLIFGLGYKVDNTAVWTKLENHLLNSPSYNHIADLNNGKDSRRAWYALKDTCEGEDFQ